MSALHNGKAKSINGVIPLARSAPCPPPVDEAIRFMEEAAEGGRLAEADTTDALHSGAQSSRISLGFTFGRCSSPETLQTSTTVFFWQVSYSHSWRPVPQGDTGDEP